MKLSQYESHGLSAAERLEAKQNLKILDDLVDEGYPELSDYLEKKYRCITRLRKLLIRHGETSFPMQERTLPKCLYSTESEEVTAAVDKLMQAATQSKSVSENPFLGDILEYCRWIEYREDTAYVFLLRDTLLPYAYFKSRDRQNLYPWLINRTFLREVSGMDDLDDQVRLSIYDALENGADTYEAFFQYCRPRIMDVLDACPALKGELEQLLSSIPQKQIMVIESGYCATLPVAASIFSIIAVYQEYNAHSELIADKDSRLSGKWHSLFTWSLIAGILVGFGSTVTVFILTMLDSDVVRLTAITIVLNAVHQHTVDAGERTTCSGTASNIYYDAYSKSFMRQLAV